jgi:hypothetical protein
MKHKYRHGQKQINSNQDEISNKYRRGNQVKGNKDRGVEKKEFIDWKMN